MIPAQNTPLAESTLKRRAYWINEIVKLSGHFGQDSDRIEQELQDEINRDTITALLDHLRLCGSIPEHYGHDSSEEKLYSKYTDSLLAAFFRNIGLNSAVFTERGDAADVEAANENYSLVADAKAFRLSRTAKNQKDFKVEAMHGWKRSNLFAIVVCPIYQLPARNSQIYQQAIARDVCILSYAHLATILKFSHQKGQNNASDLLHKILKSLSLMNPTKDAVAYWTALNREMLEYDPQIREIWIQEKHITQAAIDYAKQEALNILAEQRRQILSMTKEQAIQYLIDRMNIDGRERVIRAVADNGLLGLG